MHTSALRRSPHLLRGFFVLAATVALSACGYSAVSPTLTQSGSAITHRALPDVCSPIAASTHLYVANTGHGNVLKFALPSRRDQIVNTLSTPGESVAFDVSQNMWVSEPHSRAVFGFAPPYNGTPFSQATTSLRKPFGIAIDSSDNLYVADMVSGTLVFNPPYTGSPVQFLPAGQAVALNSNCDVAIAGSGGVYLYGPYPTFVFITTVGLPGSGGIPSAVAFDSSNDLFVGTAGRIQDSVYVFRPPYTSGPSATITNGVKRVEGLTVDANGNLFVSDSGTSSITEYAPPYARGPTLTLRSGLRVPGGITDLSP